MHIITDIKVTMKFEIRFLKRTQGTTEISSGIEFQIESFEDLQKMLEEQKEINDFGVENEDYDFMFYPKLNFFENNKEECVRTRTLQPMTIKGVEKMFEYITEILYVNKVYVVGAKEYQYTFGYNEIEIFMEQL